VTVAADEQTEPGKSPPDEVEPQVEAPAAPAPGESPEPRIEAPGEQSLDAPGAAPDQPDGGSDPGDAPPSGDTPEPHSERPKPLQVECSQCGHMNLLTPDTSVYPLVQSSSFTFCDECEGMGNVYTGSAVMMHMTAECPKCNGRGYLNTNTMAAPAPLPPVSDSPPWPGATRDERGDWH
jgi:hypothetical protein